MFVATNVAATRATLKPPSTPTGAPIAVQFQSGKSISCGTNTLITLAAPDATTAENVGVNLTGLTISAVTRTLAFAGNQLNCGAGLGTSEACSDTPAVFADDGIYQAACVSYPEVNGQLARFFKLGVTITP
ncbi:MAG: hypothetical protein RIS79_2751 [Verrucomicrobiota bacterium]|jgi:hypothetical protein